MDHYFCRNCIARWRIGHIMLSCPGCNGHVKNGWTPDDMLRVYGPVLEAHTKVFFPTLERAVPPTYDAPATLHRLSDARRWIRLSDTLPGFKIQQSELLAAYASDPTDENWRRLDPMTQSKLVQPTRY